MSTGLVPWFVTGFSVSFFSLGPVTRIGTGGDGEKEGPKSDFL